MKKFPASLLFRNYAATSLKNDPARLFAKFLVVFLSFRAKEQIGIVQSARGPAFSHRASEQPPGNVQSLYRLSRT